MSEGSWFWVVPAGRGYPTVELHRYEPWLFAASLSRSLCGALTVSTHLLTPARGAYNEVKCKDCEAKNAG